MVHERAFLLGIGCRWVIVLLVLIYVGKNITGADSISRNTVDVRERTENKHAVKSIQVFSSLSVSSYVYYILLVFIFYALVGIKKCS